MILRKSSTSTSPLATTRTTMSLSTLSSLGVTTPTPLRPRRSRSSLTVSSRPSRTLSRLQPPTIRTTPCWSSFQSAPSISASWTVAPMVSAMCPTLRI
ncbi:hypothetical protein BDZ85DRAFT_268188 [Elsinoe ampelina]|uniref:Uncharacterized protein n=1 Tax=Elsinoe ampelina TaxID=302913 RepID=A0A6A6G1V2_9PEZI|nr:hypothetical protein BDZ85DRAFT_268188 [Elsinoe ampelina]